MKDYNERLQVKTDGSVRLAGLRGELEHLQIDGVCVCVTECIGVCTQLFF